MFQEAMQLLGSLTCASREGPLQDRVHLCAFWHHFGPAQSDHLYDKSLQMTQSPTHLDSEFLLMILKD